MLTTDSEISSHSIIHRVSGDALGMLAMTKFGVLWLLDLTGKDTIKISSVHTGSPLNPLRITKAHQISDIEIVSGGTDGTVKCTSLFNLEQTYDLYKPRKSVKDIILANDLMIVAFEKEVCFYASNQ